MGTNIFANPPLFTVVHHQSDGVMIELGQPPGAIWPRRHRTVPGCREWWPASHEADPSPPGWTAHALRHTAASLAISAGANPKVVQRMLGHASAAMTLDVYADLFDSDFDAVADRLDTLVVTVVSSSGVMRHVIECVCRGGRGDGGRR